MNTQRIIEAAKHSTTNREVLSRLENMEWAAEYAESGYTTPANGAGIYFSNWNDVGPWNDRPEDRDGTMGRVAALLERVGADIQWEDEWHTCDECGRAIRMEPNSYSWTPSYIVGDGEIVCARCVEDDPEPYMEELEGKPGSAWTLDIDPADHGYKLIEDGFESGFHPEQSNDPQKIAEWLRAQGIERFLFRVDGVGQFDVSFSVYRKVEEKEEDESETIPRGWESVEGGAK